MMAIDRILNEMVAGKTISEALSVVYEKRNVAIPFNDADLNVDVRKLRMSSRATNALLRAHLMTVGDVVEYANSNANRIRDISCFGELSATEFFEKVLDYLWDHMGAEERAAFLIDVVERNSSFERN